MDGIEAQLLEMRMDLKRVEDKVTEVSQTSSSTAETVHHLDTLFMMHCQTHEKMGKANGNGNSNGGVVVLKEVFKNWRLILLLFLFFEGGTKGVEAVVKFLTLF